MKAQNKKNDNVKQKPEVGIPVWVRDYRTRDGVIFNGWGIVTGSENHTDYINVMVVFKHHPLIISTNDYHFERQLKVVKTVSFLDSDGQSIRVSYGEYETENGLEMIFGIDTRRETVSFSLTNLHPLIDAIQKVEH